MLTTYLYLVPKLKVSGAILLFPPIYIRGVDRGNYFFTTLFCVFYQFNFNINVKKGGRDTAFFRINSSDWRRCMSNTAIGPLQ